MEQIQEQAKATVVRGNVLRLRVELTLRTMQSEGETVETDKREFVPKAGSVTAKLINGARMVPMQVEMEGNYARLADYGTLELGEYSLDIRCLDEQDLPYRCKLFGAVEVVDSTACAGIEAGVEFDAQVQHLEATFTQVGGGTAEQVQADWEQADDTQPDYIRNKPTIPTVPTRVSELENDAHYLTEHQDISGKVDKVQGKGLSTEDYTTEDKQKLAGLSNYDDTGIQNAINRIQNAIDALTGTEDTTAAINTMNEVTAFLAGLTNSDTLTAKLAELRTLIDQKASSAALENLATKAELASKADKSNTYTKTQVDDKIADHTHENMAKLVVCEESDLPSTLDPATIYAQVDNVSSPTAIEKLWIAGVEFAGGGGSSVEPTLPAGYVECEYVQSSNPTTIVTNTAPVGTKWMLDLEASPTSGNQIFVCSNANGGLFAAVNSSGNFALGVDNVLSSAAIRSEVWIEFTTDSTIMKIGSDSTQRVFSPGSHHDNYVSLLGYNNNYKYVGKIYRIRCTEGGFFNGVPARQLSTGNYGIYDLVNNVFFTGEFTGVVKQ